MSDLENIKKIDRIITMTTFWLAIVAVIILVFIGIHYSYEQFHYVETNDAQVQEEINPVISRLSGYAKEIRFQENQEVKKVIRWSSSTTVKTQPLLLRIMEK